MSDGALLLVVTAAFLHAAWNYLLKKCGGGLGVLTLSAITASVVLTPFAPFLIWQGFSFPWGVWASLGMIAGAGLLHMVYFLLLDRAYRSVGSGGDLSVVYPLARATGPLLTIVAATLFFGEHMTPIAVAGAVLIGVSALILTGDPRKLFSRHASKGVGFALLCGGMIASYTLWDKQAVALFLIPPVVFDWGCQCRAGDDAGALHKIARAAGHGTCLARSSHALLRLPRRPLRSPNNPFPDAPSNQTNSRWVMCQIFSGNAAYT